MLTEETTNTSYAEIRDITGVLDNYTGTGRLLIDLGGGQRTQRRHHPGRR